MPRLPAPRYGIAEWFGRDITTLTPQERQEFGQTAIRREETGELSPPPSCPFLSAVIPGSKCSKAGGVCSIRKYARSEDGLGVPVERDKIVTVCPVRFLQPLSEGDTLFLWIAEKMLGISNATVVKETPFLRKILAVPTVVGSEDADTDDGEDDDKKRAGRIDWLLVNPETMESSELDWCAVETQSLYFSGKKMRLEFEAYAAAPSPVLFPIGFRRPDYRSSGPKRLSPQLDVKVPVLRNWGKKVAVLIDRYFYDRMGILDDAFPRAKNDEERRDNAEVVWFVVDFDEDLHLRRSNVVFTTLDGSRKALEAAEPLSKADFTRALKEVINDPSRSNKVFKASGSKAPS